MATSADVAARRDKHGADHRKGEPQTDVDDRDHQPNREPSHLRERGDEPEPEYPDTRDQKHHRDEHDGDHGEPGDELAVYHVVAVDGL